MEERTVIFMVQFKKHQWKNSTIIGGFDGLHAPPHPYGVQLLPKLYQLIDFNSKILPFCTHSDPILHSFQEIICIS